MEQTSALPTEATPLLSSYTPPFCLRPLAAHREAPCLEVLLVQKVASLQVSDPSQRDSLERWPESKISRPFLRFRCPEWLRGPCREETSFDGSLWVPSASAQADLPSALLQEFASRNPMQESWHLQKGSQGSEKAIFTCKALVCPSKPHYMCQNPQQISSFPVFLNNEKGADTLGALGSDRQSESHIYPDGE